MNGYAVTVKFMEDEKFIKEKLCVIADEPEEAVQVVRGFYGNVMQLSVETIQLIGSALQRVCGCNTKETEQLDNDWSSE